jgi:transposase
VTDTQWEAIKQHFPKRRRNRQAGRPPLEDRQCFAGILWILWTGTPWSELPARYGAKSAVYRRLKKWAEADILLNLWRAFLNQLSDQQKVRWDACFIDGMFIRAKKGVHWSGRRKAAREHSVCTGRWRGYSARKTPGGGFPVGGHARRSDDRERQSEDRPTAMR